MASKALAVRTRTRYIARPRRRSRTKLSIPMAVVAGLAVPLVEVVSHIKYGPTGENGYMDVAQRIFTGSSPAYPGFNQFWFKWSYYPMIAGFAAHWIASRVGLNRAIARAGLPLIRI